MCYSEIELRILTHNVANNHTIACPGTIRDKVTRYFSLVHMNGKTYAGKWSGGGEGGEWREGGVEAEHVGH